MMDFFSPFHKWLLCVGSEVIKRKTNLMNCTLNVQNRKNIVNKIPFLSNLFAVDRIYVDNVWDTIFFSLLLMIR